MPPKQPDVPEIPTVKVTVRLIIKRNEEGPSEIIVTTDKGVKPTSSAKGWINVPKEFPASTLEFRTTLIISDALKGVQGILVSFSPSSDKKPISESNPITQMNLIFFNGPYTSMNDNWAANLQLADDKLRSLTKWDALGWALWS